MANLISPTVDLFVYDIRKEFGQTLDDLQNNRENFRKKLPDFFDDSCWQRDNEFEPDFIELLSEKTKIESLSFIANDCQGYYYPVRLQDTYGVLISCSARDKNFPYPVPWLHEAKTILDEKIADQTVTLGQTWMVSAQLDWQTSTHNNPELLAKECYLSLFPHHNWHDNLKSVNTFLGGTIFELWQYQTHLSETLDESNLETLVPNDLEPNHHLIIAIYPDQEAATAATYFLDDWLRLWCYRHKIWWSYSQSRFLKQILEGDLSEIQQYLEKFKKEINRGYTLAKLDVDLVQIEDIFANYILDLHDFKSQICTLTDNRERYSRQIETIENTLKTERLPADLYALKAFIQNSSDQFLWQMQQDWERLQNGERLLETATNLLRTEIEIYQAKSQHDFQAKAIATGWGLGSGIVVAAIAYRAIALEIQPVQTASEQPSPQDISQALFSPHVWVMPGISLILGACAAILTGGIARLWLLWGDRVSGRR
jgi:hypothetical protein